MTWNAPRLVTIELRSTPFSAATGAEPLCVEEMLALINEIGDLGVPTVRFTIAATEASDGMLRAIEHARRRKLRPIVALRGSPGGDLIGPIVEAGAATIAVPLHSRVPSIHQALADGRGDRGRSISLAGLVRDTASTLEIETRVTSANALPLFLLLKEVEMLGAVQWRLTFDGSSYGSERATTAAGVVTHAMARDGLRIIVHDLPQLPAMVTNPLRWFQPPAPANLEVINAGQSMRISYCGDVYFDQHGSDRAGSIRHSPIDAIAPMLRGESSGISELAADHDVKAAEKIPPPLQSKAFVKRVTSFQSA